MLSADEILYGNASAGAPAALEPNDLATARTLARGYTVGRRNRAVMALWKSRQHLTPQPAPAHQIVLEAIGDEIGKELMPLDGPDDELPAGSRVELRLLQGLARELVAEELASADKEPPEIDTPQLRRRVGDQCLLAGAYGPYASARVAALRAALEEAFDSDGDSAEARAAVEADLRLIGDSCSAAAEEMRAIITVVLVDRLTLDDVLRGQGRSGVIAYANRTVPDLLPLEARPSPKQVSEWMDSVVIEYLRAESPLTLDALCDGAAAVMREGLVALCVKAAARVSPRVLCRWILLSQYQDEAEKEDWRPAAEDLHAAYSAYCSPDLNEVYARRRAMNDALAARLRGRR